MLSQMCIILIGMDREAGVGWVGVQLCGDPYVTTLTHLWSRTAQERYVVPQTTPFNPKLRQVSQK